MGEVIRDKYRGRGVALCRPAQPSARCAALVYAGLYAVLPESIAWRALFAVGILPAFLVFWVRVTLTNPMRFRRVATSVREAAPQPNCFRISRCVSMDHGQARSDGRRSARRCVRCAVLDANYYARCEDCPLHHRHLCVHPNGGCAGRFLLGAYLSDIIGRKLTFFISAAATAIMC